MNAKKVDTPLLDDAFAPEIFATHASGFSIPGGTVVSVALASQRFVDGEFQDVTTARLVMPVAGVQNLIEGLTNFLANLSPPSDAETSH